MIRLAVALAFCGEKTLAIRAETDAKSKLNVALVPLAEGTGVVHGPTQAAFALALLIRAPETEGK